MSLPTATYGLVTLNGVALDAAGRVAMNYQTLVQPAPWRANAKVMPGVAGKRGGKKFRDSRDVQLQVFLDGRWDYSGAASVDPVAAVESHIRSLETAICDDAGDSEGSVPISVSSAAAGHAWSGRVVVLDYEYEHGIGAHVTTFSLRILRGRLVYA